MPYTGVLGVPLSALAWLSRFGEPGRLYSWPSSLDAANDSLVRMCAHPLIPNTY